MAAKGKTALFYQNNPSAAQQHRDYQAKLNKKPSEVKKRVELNKKNLSNHKLGKSRVGDGKDVAHTRRGLTLKKASSNRGSKTDSPGDIRARGKKK
jgi:hypothetical protein